MVKASGRETHTISPDFQNHLLGGTERPTLCPGQLPQPLVLTQVSNMSPLLFLSLPPSSLRSLPGNVQIFISNPGLSPELLTSQLGL